MEAIKGWVVNIAAVAVLMIILDLLMPEGKIRKFTQLVAGFILMFVMINPVLDLFGKGISASFAGWADETFLWSSQVKNMAGGLQDERNEQTLELYRSMLLSDIQSRLESHEQIQKAGVDVVINENDESKDYGQIRKLYINLKFDNAGQNRTADQKDIMAEIKRELQQVFLLDKDEIIIQISEGE